MTLRQRVKHGLYGRAGVFPYCGSRVFFPKGSLAFREVCTQGIYEADNVRLCQKLCRAGTYMFDIGANLGLMALPVLNSVPDSRVVSFEPSPNSLPWLKRTIARRALGERWQLVEKAASASAGRAEFSMSTASEGLFDGLRNTGRSSERRRVMVEVTTLDIEWGRLDTCPVSLIKIDVEGAELDVLRGAQDCLDGARPFVLLEWCRLNLHAYSVPDEALYHFACEHRYRLYSLPHMAQVLCPSEVGLQLLRTESFLMAPV